MLKKVRNRKGFTLVELLIVVAIVGILAALLIPNLITALQKSKQKGTMKDINTLGTAITDYITDNQVGPTSAGAIDQALQNILAPFYLKVCPQDDQWGFPIEVHSGQAADTDVRGCIFSGLDDFVVFSLGRDGAADDFSYDETQPELGMYIVSTMADFGNDLIMFDGTFVRAPQTRGGGQAQ